MSLTYNSIIKYSDSFLHLSGLKVVEFSSLVKKVRRLYEKVESNKKCHGRAIHLASLEDKLLCVLLYYRTYISHVFLGYLFNLHNSNICRLLKRMEVLLANKITINKNRSLTPEKILKIILDASEEPPQRPTKKQKQSYSGKKKKHTIKTEIALQEDGKILSISKSHKDRKHTIRPVAKWWYLGLIL